jgi:lipopolysaccharide heptosyltransferase II
MEKIIITPLIGMGDTLMTTPALRLIKTRHPDWRITYSTISASNYELLKGNPYIDDLHYYPLKAAGIFNGPWHIFRRFFGKYSVSLTFYPSNRASYNLFALLTGAPRRIGHTYMHRNASQLNWLKDKTLREEPLKHCVEQNVSLLSFLGISCAKDEIPDLEIFLSHEEKRKGLEFRKNLSGEKVIGVHAGTSTFKNQDKRRWPKERFCELINRFSGHHFILFGTKEEEEVNLFIQSNVAQRERVTVVNDKPLREAIAIIGNCDAFVSNDSGLMHIAAAMKVPTLALLGPTNPAYIHPWKVPYRLARSGIECSPCYYYSPKPLTCPRKINYKCMQEIKVDMAEQGLKKLGVGGF